jgi:hypothetical protein
MERGKDFSEMVAKASNFLENIPSPAMMIRDESHHPTTCWPDAFAIV